MLVFGQVGVGVGLGLGFVKYARIRPGVKIGDRVGAAMRVGQGGCLWVWAMGLGCSYKA